MAQWLAALAVAVSVVGAMWRYTIMAERRFTRLEEQIALTRTDIQNLFLTLPKRSGDYFRVGGH